MSRPSRVDEPRALDLLEDAVLLLASASPATWAVTLGGTLPFVAAALLAGFDLAREGGAAAALPVTSLGLALLFVTMKGAQAVFCERLRAEGLGGSPPGSLASPLATVARQAAIAPWALVVLPLAFVATVPFGTASAFFQSAIAEGRREPDLRALVRRAGRQAALWPGQNHQLLLVLLAFRLFVFLNVGLLLASLPLLLRALAGVETELARAGTSLFSVPLLVVAWAVTHLLVDPLVKAVHVLRCFHGESRRTGEDLLLALARRGGVVAALLFPLLLALPAGAGPAAVDPARLDRSLGDVLAGRRFAWHLPKVKGSGQMGFFEDLFRATNELVTGLAGSVMKALDRFATWLSGSIRWGPGPAHDAGGAGSVLDARLLAVTVLALVAAAAGLLALRLLRARRAAPAPVPVALPPVDLLAPEVPADSREPDEWLALGQEWLGKGDARRALRALYLAALAALSRGERVRLAPHKTNGDYVAELARRSPRSSDLPSLFAALAREFDRAWYGEHPVDAASLERFRDDVLAVQARAAL